MAVQKQNNLSEFTILNNWFRDGNLKSQYPSELSNCRIGIAYLLYYFVQSPKYFITINKIFNSFDAVGKIKPVDAMKQMKEMIHFTGYNSFQRKKIAAKDNELIDLMWKKYPYYKREDICMIVDFIDKSEDKDCIYEMFGLIKNPKVKKMTKAKANKRSKTLSNIIKSDDILDLM